MKSAVNTLETHSTSIIEKYEQYVNPQWVKLISVLGLNRHFDTSLGAELFTDNNEVFLDFLSGYGVYNAGHHHPYITNALIDQLKSRHPTMLQSTIPTLAADLAERLCGLAGGRVEKAFFTSSGSEGVESAIKFSRAFTKRDWILSAKGAFHGLTCGALSLMSDNFWKEGFGPLLQEVQTITFGDIDALRLALSSRKFASFIVEPIQAEAGLIIPNKEYFKQAQALCDQYGTLLVLDEVQTGLHRTGPFIAAHHFDIEPDMVILAKALSGGQVPVGALLMRSDICNSVFKSIDKAFVHASTFGENALAMRAGLATLDVLRDENLEEKSIAMGEKFRQTLRQRLERFEIIKEVRGLGLFNAIEFQPPTSFGTKMLFSAFKKAHPGLFGQMIVKTLFEDEKILCQMCGNNYMVIKTIPPLTVNEQQIDRFAAGIERTCEMILNDKTKFWMQGLKIATKSLI